MASVVPTPLSLAKESERKKVCLDTAAKASFKSGYCDDLEADLSKVEGEVRSNKKDPNWKAVCLDPGPGLCVPELDIDQDGKSDRIYLMEKLSGKKKRRMMVIRSPNTGMKFLEKSSDVTIASLGLGVTFDLKRLTYWSVESGDDPRYAEFKAHCGIRSGIKVLELYADDMPHVLTVKQGRYCYLRIGD